MIENKLMEKDLPDKYQPKEKVCHNINTRKIEYKAKIINKDRRCLPNDEREHSLGRYNSTIETLSHIAKTGINY